MLCSLPWFPYTPASGLQGTLLGQTLSPTNSSQSQWEGRHHCHPHTADEQRYREKSISPKVTSPEMTMWSPDDLTASRSCSDLPAPKLSSRFSVC